MDIFNFNLNKYYSKSKFLFFSLNHEFKFLLFDCKYRVLECPRRTQNRARSATTESRTRPQRGPGRFLKSDLHNKCCKLCIMQSSCKTHFEDGTFIFFINGIARFKFFISLASSVESEFVCE